MITKLMYYFAIFGKIVVFLFILMVMLTAIINHGKPKISVHDKLFASIILHLILITFYAINGILNNLTIGLICVALFHLGDIVETIRKNGYVEFTIFNAYKSVPTMIFYFMSLYLTNFWSPVLVF